MGQLTCLPSPASAHQPACLPASASLQRAMSIPADLRSYRTDFINKLLAGNFKVLVQVCSLEFLWDGAVWFVARKPDENGVLRSSAVRPTVQPGCCRSPACILDGLNAQPAQNQPMSTPRACRPWSSLGYETCTGIPPSCSVPDIHQTELILLPAGHAAAGRAKECTEICPAQ